MYLRFISPCTSRDMIFDRFPPGQQPQRRTAIAATSSREKAKANRKATKGMITNWHTRASSTPMGLRMCSPSWLTSTVQPSPSMVKQRTSPTKTLIPWLSGESQKSGIRWGDSVWAAAINSAPAAVLTALLSRKMAPRATPNPAMTPSSGESTTCFNVSSKGKSPEPAFCASTTRRLEFFMAQQEDGESSQTVSVRRCSCVKWFP